MGMRNLRVSVHNASCSREAVKTMAKHTIGSGRRWAWARVLARLTALILVLGAASSALGGCRDIIGINEGGDELGAGGDGGAQPGANPEAQSSPQCQAYCTKARDVCGELLYRTDEACLATCAVMPLEGFGQDSVACRERQLYNAVQTGEDRELYCANAGPGGNGACGSNCENYCRLFKEACPSIFWSYAMAPDSRDDDGVPACIAKCQGITDTHLYDSRDTGNYLGDTLQCRIVHTTSSLIDPVAHCAHAALRSFKCVDDPTAIPDCAAFCRLELVACGRHPGYESEAQCIAVCHALPPGQSSDIEQNTVGCRMFHSYNALLNPDAHCAHTGPGGDGHCGSSAQPGTGSTGNCESYCMLLERACQADFNAQFADPAECQAECVTLEGAGPSMDYWSYPLVSVGDNVQCRLLHVSRALTDPKECAAARGAAPCN